eukprot:5682415-Amphidinium_carterae.1
MPETHPFCPSRLRKNHNYTPPKVQHCGGSVYLDSLTLVATCKDNNICATDPTERLATAFDADIS